MTTLLTVYKRNRKRLRGVACVGVCDARCYNAMQPSQLKEPRRNACACICGGRNHAGGLTRALQNSANLVGLEEKDVQRFADERGYDRGDLVVIDRMRIRTDERARIFAASVLVPAPAGPDLFSCEALQE